jgi:hypothetical protein
VAIEIVDAFRAKGSIDIIFTWLNRTPVTGFVNMRSDPLNKGQWNIYWIASQRLQGQGWERFTENG